jgi:hypothetical protein
MTCLPSFSFIIITFISCYYSFNNRLIWHSYTVLATHHTGVVTKPFGFEGRRRMQQALQAIENLRAVVDTLIIVSNDRLVGVFNGTYFPPAVFSPCFSTIFILSFALYVFLLLSSFLSFSSPFFFPIIFFSFLCPYPFSLYRLFSFSFLLLLSMVINIYLLNYPSSYSTSPLAHILFLIILRYNVAIINIILITILVSP